MVHNANMSLINCINCNVGDLTDYGTFTNSHYFLLQMKDLVYFLVILGVFILSFGIAFQALIDNGNVQPTWDLLADIVYRPYWQMYGELFLDDDGMGS